MKLVLLRSAILALGGAALIMACNGNGVGVEPAPTGRFEQTRIRQRCSEPASYAEILSPRDLPLLSAQCDDGLALVRTESVAGNSRQRFGRVDVRRFGGNRKGGITRSFSHH